ncbi:MAG TPA: phosphoribosylglycinamide formyltransferase [Caldithrix abyssi]|uniref:Phosphoribosylglycinamide formyltransferase n=1 Tax=Caldithrix abyssi TaxID=187145 RepID=A0A7V4WUN3_CALAY|nr:phosphoribosylglycinamide formyltransferase [Caldithrix abyssi]
MKKRIAIFISGRGSNMEAIVRNTQTGLLKDCCEIALVFSNKPRAKGLEIAAGLGLSTASIPSKGKKREEFDAEVVRLLEPYRVDYIVLAGFMRILSPVLIRAYPNRIINIHPADTKAFQGVGAYEWAWENRLEKTYITVHYVDEGVDTGPVIAQQEVDLRGAASLQEIERRGLAVEHELYSKALRKVFIMGE